jgi:hypothetical protein
MFKKSLFVQLSVLSYSVYVVDGNCATNLDCSLNGICQTSSGTCLCDSPWNGETCSSLKYSPSTPAIAKSIYNISDPRNTWNGPIVQGSDGKYHIYVPLYAVGSLGGPPTMKHGIADSIVGPWDFNTLPDLPTEGGENPAMVVFPDASKGGSLMYSLWIGGSVLLSDSPYGPFTKIPSFSYPGGNPAPIFYKGAFFMTNQPTLQIFTTPSLTSGGTWSLYSNISHASLPQDEYHVEDPFLWVDKRENWHIINHAYSNYQYDNCTFSYLSAHFFSQDDGVTWSWSSQPYDHIVTYDDGTSHDYVTLERPNLHFSSTGELTHINLAADLVTTGATGCMNRTSHTHFGHCNCDNCKWNDHAGTIIIVLGD